MSGESTELKKALTPLHLWAIGVGLVISGTYFGWNFGLADGGYIGMLIATLIMGLMYLCMVLSIAELSVMMPHAGGPYAFARRAFGPLGGYLTGIGVIMEYFFATPVVAIGVGGYVNFLWPSIDPVISALVIYAFFLALHLWGIKEYAIFETVIVFIALGLIVLMYIIGGPAVTKEHLFPFEKLIPAGNFTGIWACLPYAMWLFLAIEMMPMLAEECRDAKKDMPKGLVSAMITLLLMSTITLTVATGIGGADHISTSANVLPDAVAVSFGADHWLVRLLASVGLLGLLASFSGVILAFSREIFSMARAGYFPRFLSNLHPKRRTPHWALILPSIIGFVLLMIFGADQLILIATFGALLSYLLMSLSCIVLRIKEPDAVREWKVPLYPVTPAIAVILSAITLFSSIFADLPFFGVNMGILALAVIWYFAYSKKHIDPNAPEERLAMGLEAHEKGGE